MFQYIIGPDLITGSTRFLKISIFKRFFKDGEGGEGMGEEGEGMGKEVRGRESAKVTGNLKQKKGPRPSLLV